MDKDTVLKLALEALEIMTQPVKTNDETTKYKAEQAITAIKQALAAPVQKGAIGAEYQKSPWDGKGISMPPPAAPVQEPVAWMHTMIDDVVIGHRPTDLKIHPDRWIPLYKDPTPCQTCQSLARAVMMDQTAHDTTPPAAPVQEPVAGQPLPCPFCGHIGLDFSDGETYRWGVASCGGCGASCGDVRREYPDQGEWHTEAIAEWNRRSPAAPDLQAELDATNRQVEILTDALAESRREIDAMIALARADEGNAIIDLVAVYGGPVDLEAAIRARGNT